ncbi:Dehydrogenase/reductase SDR family member 11, partial [Blattella germanica]
FFFWIVIGYKAIIYYCLQELSQSLKSEKGELHPVKCDITNDEERKMAFEWVKTNLGGVDILVNNAGLAIDTPLIGIVYHTFTDKYSIKNDESLSFPIDGSPVDLKNMLILNVLALTLCTQEALKSMKDNGVDDGHIIHINSCGGHVPPIDHYAMYFATKHAVTALTEGLRKELMAKKSNIRVTSLSPGLVKTDMVPDKLLKVRPYIQAENIADALLYILSVPADVQVMRLQLLNLFYNYSISIAIWFGSLVVYS